MRRLSGVLLDLGAACVQPGWTQDLRHAVRSLTRAWGFSLTIVTLLGVGLGVTTAIFSLFYGILLRPFPYPSPDSLVRVDWLMPTGQSQASSLGDLALWRDARSLSGIGPFSTSTTEIRGNGPAETVQVTYVSAATLPLLGVRPQLGRPFEAEQDAPNGDVHKALLSDALWTRLFARDPAIVGRLLQQGEGSLEIVGVMPPDFAFPGQTELWVPVESTWARSSRAATQRTTVRIYSVLARLNGAATTAHAREEIQALSDGAAARPSDVAVRVRTLRDAETGTLRPYLTALLGGVACLALICVTNVSSLQLARGTVRAREFAVRAAIGASAGRNLRILLAESLVLTVVGALAATAVAVVVLRLTLASIPTQLPAWMQLEVDAVALTFCVLLVGAAATLSAILPAWRALGQDGHALLKAGGRGSTDRGGLRQGLVIGEIALSTVLLVSACLLVQSLFALQAREPGFRPHGLLTVKVSRAHAGSLDLRLKALPPLHARVLEQLRALPGVRQVSASNRLPFASGANSRTVADLHVTGAEGPAQTRASFFGSADVTPGYFAVMGIPLLRGRSFASNDHGDTGRVVIINDRAAKQLWPGRDPIGQQITWGTPRPDNPPATVVGIVGNVRDVASDADRGLEFYYPYAQFPANPLFYVIQTSVEPTSLIASVRQTIAATDPSVAVSVVKTMTQWIDESLWQTRLWGWLFGLFAVLALALAAAGLYGLVSYLIARRAKEIVIRMSVGATTTHIARLILGGMTRVIVMGVALGLLASFAASRLIGTLLFQVSATDVRVLLLVSLIVSGVTLLACCPPVLHTRRVDVCSVLQEDP